MKGKKIILLTVLTMLFATNLSTLAAEETDTTAKQEKTTYVAPRLGDKTLGEIMGDYDLAIMIANKIGMHPDSILTDELAEKLVDLDLVRLSNPTNLVGLEVFPNLKELNAGRMDKDRLIGLNKATQIEKFTVWSRDMTDLEMFRGMTGLKSLLVGGPITDISAASTLVNLESFDIDDFIIPGQPAIRGQLTSIEPLKNLTKLKSLGIPWQKEIKDYSPLAYLTNLESFTIPGSNITVKDLSYISNMDLRHINIGLCDLPNLNALSKMENLEYLSAYESNISDISGLKNLTNLNHVDLRDNHIMDFSVINSTKDSMDFFYAPGNTVTLPKQRAIDSLTLNLNSHKADGTPLTLLQTDHRFYWPEGNQDLSATALTWEALTEDVTQLSYNIIENNSSSPTIFNTYGVNVSFDVEYYGIVNVKYIDEDGVEITHASVTEANVGDSFKVLPKTIAGYKLVETDGVTTGTMAFGQRSEVVYTYEAVSNPSIDVNGKEISKPSTSTQTSDSTNIASLFVLMGVSILGLISVKLKRNANK